MLLYFRLCTKSSQKSIWEMFSRRETQSQTKWIFKKINEFYILIWLSVILVGKGRLPADIMQAEFLNVWLKASLVLHTNTDNNLRITGESIQCMDHFYMEMKFPPWIIHTQNLMFCGKVNKRQKIFFCNSSIIVDFSVSMEASN